MAPPQDAVATVIGGDLHGRLFAAAGWTALALVPVLVVARGSEQRPIILGLGLVVCVPLFVALARTRRAIVTAEEVRLPRRTIRRTGVARIERTLETTAFVFRDADGRIVGLADLSELSGQFRDALRSHGWPEVGPPA